jgi:hypothetical protein
MQLRHLRHALRALPGAYRSTQVCCVSVYSNALGMPVTSRVQSNVATSCQLSIRTASTAHPRIAVSTHPSHISQTKSTCTCHYRSIHGWQGSKEATASSGGSAEAELHRCCGTHALPGCLLVSCLQPTVGTAATRPTVSPMSHICAHVYMQPITSKTSTVTGSIQSNVSAQQSLCGSKHSSLISCWKARCCCLPHPHTVMSVVPQCFHRLQGPTKP